MKAVAWVAVVLAALLAVAAVACFVAAIWIVGPNSMRMAGTGVMALFVGGALGFLGSLWLETRDGAS